MRVLKTRFTDLLKIEAPVQLAGMPGVGTVELAAAVANAGGLGGGAKVQHRASDGAMTGDIGAMALYAGESPFAVKTVQDAGDIVREMTNEAGIILAEKR